MRSPPLSMMIWVGTLMCLPVFHALAQSTPPATAPAKTTAAASTTENAAESPWPLTIKTTDTTFIAYQPQLDSWDGHTLVARFAIKVGDDPKIPSTFGVVTISARTLTDKGTRLVTLDQAKVLKSEFPSKSSAEAQHWSDAIAKDLVGRSRTVALDRLEMQLDIAKTAGSTRRQPLRNEPPRILFSSVPAILIYIDGEPVYRAMPDHKVDRVVNTRPFLARLSGGAHYLKIFDGWMSAPSLTSPWSVVTPPVELEAGFKTAADARLVDPMTGRTTPNDAAPSLSKQAPTIIVATTPTELIVTQGEPLYVPIQNTKLLYVGNTTGHIFKDTADNSMYVLTAGRWFKASSEKGPWEFVAANALPTDFSNIPDDSLKENVKASVSGTPQSREAAIEASVPQTAAVKMSGATLSPPQFDGEPQFKAIAGTQLDYVANTATPIVCEHQTTCYALENAVWFVASAPRGPWSVAHSVPAAIYEIPPSSPLYYVTFVRIYAVEGDTVYVGYTPGYQGTYVDPVSTVVVYGTGYHYDPWLGTTWYGGPCTYGFGSAVAYTPWTGWGVTYGQGWSWSTATVVTGWGWGAYPWWGPWGWGWAYGPAYYPWYPAWGGAAVGPNGGAVAWGPGGWAGYTGNIYQNWGNRASVWHGSGGYNAWTGNAWAGQSGIAYNSRTGVASAGQRGVVQNVYTGDYAAGSRGAAVGPQGGAIVGQRGTVGNAYTGNEVSGGRGAVYNPDTGQWTKYGRATGQNGNTIARVGDDVYAGHDGNVYRRTDSGWEQRTDGSWQSVPGGAEGPATRDATGGLGTNRESLSSDRTRQLDRDFQSRQSGAERAGQVRRSSMGMNRSFRGGGFRGRR